MEFSYQAYRIALVDLPIKVTLFNLIIIAVSTIWYIAKKEYKKKVSALKRLYGLVGLSIFVWTVLFGVKPFVIGGHYLLEEDESAQIASEGVIEKIVESSKRYGWYKDSSRAITNIETGERLDETVLGADITIDSVEYFAETAGDFQVGDHVVISHIIMSIVAAPEE